MLSRKQDAAHQSPPIKSCTAPLKQMNYLLEKRDSLVNALLHVNAYEIMSADLLQNLNFMHNVLQLSLVPRRLGLGPGYEGTSAWVRGLVTAIGYKQIN